MTEEIIKFPVVKRPPKGSFQKREVIRDAILTAINLKKLGLGPENLSANMDPDERKRIELITGVIEERQP